jgi:hypothetical protein
MKRIIVLLLLATLYSCTNNSQNTNNSKQTLNAKIEKDGDEVYLRNTSQNNKCQFTISIFITDTVNQSNHEVQEIITLNPGQRNRLGTNKKYDDYCGCSGRRMGGLGGTSYYNASTTTPCGHINTHYFGNIEYKIAGELNLNAKER